MNCLQVVPRACKSSILFLEGKQFMYCRAHHTCKKQGDLTSPSVNMRDKWRHDRETSNNFKETCFCKNVLVSAQHLKCDFANILLISFIFNFKFMFCTCIIVVDLIFVDFRFYSFCSDQESHAHLQLKWRIKLTVGCTVKSVFLSQVVVLFLQIFSPIMEHHGKFFIRNFSTNGND